MRMASDSLMMEGTLPGKLAIDIVMKDGGGGANGLLPGTPVNQPMCLAPGCWWW